MPPGLRPEGVRRLRSGAKRLPFDQYGSERDNRSDRYLWHFFSPCNLADCPNEMCPVKPAIGIVKILNHLHCSADLIRRQILIQSQKVFTEPDRAAAQRILRVTR